MNDSRIAFLPMTELARLLRARDLTPVDLTEHLIGRIEAMNGRLNAFLLVLADRAMAEARAAEALQSAGLFPGPLHGIPYAVKDLFDMTGLPTTAGSRTLADAPAEGESAATARLAAAGMIALGKTITVEFAKGIVGINHIQGTPHNPWDRVHRVPGGSSAGTAVAVAAGLAPMGLGTDTGGSVRAPAGLCGTVGLKTTVGRISRHGVFPLSWTLDSVGPLTRTVEDAALVYQAVQGEDERDPVTLGIDPVDPLPSLKAGVRGMRIGIPEAVFYENLDPEVEKAVRAAADLFRDLGARVETIRWPESERAYAMGSIVNGVEASVIHEERLKTMVHLMDPVVGQRMLPDLEIPAIDYARALRELADLRRSQAETLRDVDVTLIPTTPIPAAPVAEVDATLESYLVFTRRYLQSTNVGNRLGLCGLSLPCGFTHGGLPIGLLINGKPFDEHLVLRAGYAYEQATDWHRRQPDLSWLD